MRTSDILKKTNSDQIPVIDTLRGVAALSVCLFHFVTTTTAFISNSYIHSVFSFGKYGVQMFFIISGIVIPLSMINAGYNYSSGLKFIARRFLRIEPPYLMSIGIALIYLTIRNYIPSSSNIDLRPSAKEVLLHLGYLIPFVKGSNWINPPYWTLAVEFQYYIFLTIFFPLVLRSMFLLRIIFYTVLIIPSFFYLGGSDFFPFWGVYFLLGIVYVLYYRKIISFSEYAVITVLAEIITGIYCGVTDVFVSVITLSIIHFFPSYTSVLGRFFGKISYSLYLLHSIIGAAFVNFMAHRVQGCIQKTLVVCGGIALSVLSAYLMYKLVEKPSQNLARKIKF